MPEPLKDTIRRLLRYQRAPVRATRQFRKWKHNADILPKLQTQLEMLLDAYGKFEPVVYDTQGIHDDGSDVVLRYCPESGEKEFELICFQVKSFDDLLSKAYMQELKAQRDDSFRKVIGLQWYFLLLCTDNEKHKDKIRSISSEFRSADRTEIIEPAFAYTFLHHPKTRVEALVKRTMEADDLVFRRALEFLDSSSPSARALTVFLAVKSAITGATHFTLDQLLSELTLRRTYDELRERQSALLEESLADSRETGDEETDEEKDWDDIEEPPQVGEFQDQLAADLELLEGDVELNPSSESLDLRLDQMRPLNAVIVDALARYEYNEDQLMSYMFSLMGVQD